MEKYRDFKKSDYFLGLNEYQKDQYDRLTFGEACMTTIKKFKEQYSEQGMGEAIAGSIRKFLSNSDSTGFTRSASFPSDFAAREVVETIGEIGVKKAILKECCVYSMNFSFPSMMEGIYSTPGTMEYRLQVSNALEKLALATDQTSEGEAYIDIINAYGNIVSEAVYRPLGRCASLGSSKEKYNSLEKKFVKNNK